MFTNSARKNMEKEMPEYSVWKPPVSSDSASLRSRGPRLSSAVEEIRKRTKARRPASGSLMIHQSATVALLGEDDVPQGAGAAGHDHQQHAQDHGQLVGEELGPGAHGAQHGILVVGSPAADQHAEDAQAGHGRQIDHARLRVHHLQVGVERHDGQDQEGAGDGQERSQEIGQAVHRPRGLRFSFMQQLEGVGDGLEQAEGTDPGGSEPRLEMGADLALHPDEERWPPR